MTSTLRWPLRLALATTLLVAACGSPDLANEEDIIKQPDGSAGQGGAAGAAAQGGASGNAGAMGFACAADESVFYGAPVDPANACLDTAALVPIGCGRLEERTGEPCLRRRADGAKLWSMLEGVARFDPALWESCPNELGAPEPRPPVCATRTCASPAPAFCAPDRVAEVLSCGSPIGEWDESCCQRPACKTVDDCAAGLDCRSVTLVSTRCWPGADAQSCDCAPVPVVVEELRCVPTPSG